LTAGTIRVAFVTADLGLGGTGKGVVSFATRLDRSRFAPQVITLIQGGPREADLTESGVPFVLGCGDADALSRELEGVDVVHVFRHGIADSLVPAAAARAGVPVLIESNIFGSRDRSPDEQRFACHLFGSMMCLTRYRHRVPADGGFEARHRVLCFPPEADRLRRKAPDRAQARRALGLDPARPVVARVGRAQDLKWRNLLVDMVPHLIGLVPEVQVVFVGPTVAKRARLARRGVLDRVTLIDQVVGDGDLATLYAACDVVVNASMIGESQGLVIAEAMALGIPVVTCSTPWVDNAQVEFVDNGHTGWVANHPREFAEAVADLLIHPGRRTEFGRRARDEIDRLLDPELLTRQLQDLYQHHLHGTEIDWRPASDEIARFEREYPARARASFRPLTPRERAEAFLTRAKEGATRRSAGARMAASNARRCLRRRD
jgi:glycosyltransferase involved in cell wall biosynthesis